MTFLWLSRVTHVHPEMWQIYIEAVVTPHELAFSSSSAKAELSFDMLVAVRGKNSDEEEWHQVFDQSQGEDAGKWSKVTVSCQVEVGVEPDFVCDQFEVGIIGVLDY